MSKYKEIRFKLLTEEFEAYEKMANELGLDTGTAAIKATVRRQANKQLPTDEKNVVETEMETEPKKLPIYNNFGDVIGYEPR